jgi:hypothetical protein
MVRAPRALLLKSFAAELLALDGNMHHVRTNIRDQRRAAHSRWPRP